MSNRAGFANNINLNADFLNNSDVLDFDYEEDDELHCKVGDEICSKSKYILESDLGAFCSIEKGTFLNIMHLNCRSLKKSNFLEISQLMNVHGRQISVLAITETWLNELNKDLFQIEGYNFISKCRESKHGGGVGLYIDSNYDYVVRDELCTSNKIIECLFVEVVRPSKSAVYRPPNAELKLFNAEINLLTIIDPCKCNPNIIMKS